MENQVIYQIPRSSDEKIYVSLREYKERKYLDLRIFFRPKEGGDLRPTKKGVTLSLELFPELKKAVALCEKKLAVLHD